MENKGNNVKSAAIFFTNKRFTPDANLNFKFNNENIPSKTDYKYLPIHLDSKLSWFKHVSETLRRSNCAAGSLNPLLAWKKSRQEKLNWCCINLRFSRSLLIDRRFTEVFRKPGLKKFQYFQNKLMRRLTTTTRYICNDVIHRDIKIRPVLGEIRKLAIKFHRSISSVRNPDLNLISQYDASIIRRKPPLAVLSLDNNFVPFSKTSKKKISGVTKRRIHMQVHYFSRLKTNSSRIAISPDVMQPTVYFITLVSSTFLTVYFY